MPKHLGLTDTSKVSSTVHTQEKQFKCTVKKKETSLIHQPPRLSFSLANIRLPVGIRISLC